MKKISTFVVMFLAIWNAEAGLCVPPGSSGARFSDPEMQARYEREQKMLKDGPYLPEAKKALPIASDLVDFDVKIVTQDTPISDSATGQSVEAVRLEDKAVLRVAVFASSNPEVVEFRCNRFLRRDARGVLPQGSPSGKPLGQKSWQTWPQKPKSNFKEQSYWLQVQDGPSVINMWLQAAISVGPKGEATWKPLTQEDRLWCEHIARDAQASQKAQAHTRYLQTEVTTNAGLI